ncbi:DUF4097 family beta strand repeat-containing protein [Nonomuraea sp. LP-02]|uniref:DUF4097 family beta strand repeat-containing protein n=1 Tax=Nonomuraea sp. LP-02 TaxID=3097960 RepID=UPI002E30A03C|nr:DUF4097 family beta strand repeat-containing protein [Nonomuraea sp. LP-02]MED7926442.1 DUF4097 family beta strand repeat-containing protein [Nonomuraea sp. LP-02]
MRTIAIAGGLLAGAALLTGCGLDSIAGPTNKDTKSYEVTDRVTELRLDGASGDAVITETGGTAVRVTETLTWRGDSKPTPEHRIEGGVLALSYTCPSNLGSCGVDYRIEVPKGLAVDLDSGSGDITLRALSGDVRVNVGSGDVDAADLAGKNVVADSGSGNVELKYTTAPTNARLKAGSGDVSLFVPDGAYDVTTDVGSGDVTVSVKNDRSSPNKISVRTGSGNISVSAR